MTVDMWSAFQRFEKFVIDNYAQGQHIALVIDEAQNLGTERLEELRMLLNINSRSDLFIANHHVGSARVA